MQPAHHLAAAVKDGTTSPLDVLDAAFARIDAVEDVEWGGGAVFDGGGDVVGGLHRS